MTDLKLLVHIFLKVRCLLTFLISWTPLGQGFYAIAWSNLHVMYLLYNALFSAYLSWASASELFWLSVFRPSVCLYTFHIFIFFSKITGSIWTIRGKKHPWATRIKFDQMKGSDDSWDVQLICCTQWVDSSYWRS